MKIKITLNNSAGPIEERFIEVDPVCGFKPIRDTIIDLVTDLDLYAGDSITIREAD